MTDPIKEFNDNGIEVKIFEDGLVYCCGHHGEKIYIRPKANGISVYDIEIRCNENKRCSREDTVHALHRSIDIYYNEQRRSKLKDAKAETEDFITKMARDLQIMENKRSRERERRIHSSHTRLLNFVSKKGRNPKEEIDIYQYYIEHIKYGKSDEVLVAMSKKFNRTTNSLRVLMGWYNKNFLYLHKYKRNNINGTKMESINVYRVNSARSAGENRKMILASIHAYGLNFIK